MPLPCLPRRTAVSSAAASMVVNGRSGPAPRHAKARSFRTGRTGIMLAEIPYHILLNLQERDCMADRHSSMAASSACRSISRRSRTSLHDGDLTASCLLPTSDRAKLGPVDVGS